MTIYKCIKGSTHIWNPESTLVFKSRRDIKVIGRYIDNTIIVDSECINLSGKFGFTIDNTLEKFVIKNIDQSQDELIQEQEDIKQFENHPAFQEQKNQISNLVSTEFIDIFTDEFKLKISNKINDLVYRIVDLEATLKNVNNDYENLLLENQSLKRRLSKN
jgi:hypothetical protein